MLILASQSKSRGRLLKAAGVDFTAVPADIDEDAIKRTESDGKKAALMLAVKKAETVSARHPQAFVIGADQILELEGECFSKPENMEQAAEQLKKMRGKTHSLLNGAAVVKEGGLLWSINTVVKVSVRRFSDDFLAYYLDAAGKGVCSSVGAYYLEELGSQLIENVEGDYFSVLGLPVLPLFDFLRECGELKK